MVIRADRADGFVVHNLTARGALEHGIYIEETDGYRIDTVKMFWAADYGNLTFTSDHGLYTDCDGFGAGDAVLYPGAAPETGEQIDLSFYLGGPRINTVVRDCDMRGSVLAYSGSMGNNVRITHNNIYANSAGISTDSISSAGHPGYPADGVQVDHNWIYSNNLSLFGKKNPPVEPALGILPNGVGIFWAGHNNGRVHDNWIWDNWRAAAFLMSIPDFLNTPEGNVNPGASCKNPMLSTSCNNRYFRNQLGRVPKGFKSFPALRKFGNKVGAVKGRAPNGTDFWWDEGGIGSVTGNCWYANKGPNGKADSVTGPGAGDAPQVLPSNCATSTGTGDPAKVDYLLACFFAREGQGGGPDTCDWYQLPPKPGSKAAARKQQRFQAGVRSFLRSARAKQLEDQVDGPGGLEAGPPRRGVGRARGQAARPDARRLGGPDGQVLRLAGGQPRRARGHDPRHPPADQPEGQRGADAGAVRRGGLRGARPHLRQGPTRAASGCTSCTPGYGVRAVRGLAARPAPRRSPARRARWARSGSSSARSHRAGPFLPRLASRCCSSSVSVWVASGARWRTSSAEMPMPSPTRWPSSSSTMNRCQTIRSWMCRSHWPSASIKLATRSSRSHSSHRAGSARRPAGSRWCAGSRLRVSRPSISGPCSSCVGRRRLAQPAGDRRLVVDVRVLAAAVDVVGHLAVALVGGDRASWAG